MANQFDELPFGTEPLLVRTRLSPGEAAAFISQRDRLVSDPSWQRLYAVVDGIEPGPPPDFSRVSSGELVVAVNAVSCCRVTLSHMFPPSVDSLLGPDESARQTLRAELLVDYLLAVGYYAADPVAKFDELFWPFRFAPLPSVAPPERLIVEGVVRFDRMLLCNGPAEEEVERRLRAHVGGEVGRYLLYYAIGQDLGDKARGWWELEHEREQSFQAVLDRVWSATAPVRPMLLPEHGQDVRQKDVRQEVAGQILFTLDARWGRLDGFRALEAALDGKLDIAPRAVADDLRDSVRKQRRRRARQEPLDEEDIRFVLAEEGPDVLHLLLSRFRADHPEHVEGVRLLLSEEPEARLAERSRVSDRTVRTRKRRARNALQEWLRSIG